MTINPFSPMMIGLNAVSIALWTTGVSASLYAGYLNPDLRVTSSTLSAVINGGATVMMPSTEHSQPILSLPRWK